MEVIKIVGVGLVCAFVWIILKEAKPELAFAVVIIGCCVIMLMLVDYLAIVISAIKGIVDKTGIPAPVMTGVVKIIGVGYITEFGAGVCEDAGCKSIGDKVLLGGKLVIMVLSLPIITALYEVIAQLLS